MVWHLRPAGIPAFPSDTAANWAAEWFTPVDYTHLNYLVDNLNYLRNPSNIALTLTPGTVTTILTTDTHNTFLTSSFVGNGGLYYVAFSADFIANTTLPSEAIVRIKFIQGGTTLYVPSQNGTATTTVADFITVKTPTGSVYYSYSKILTVANITFNGSFTVDVGGVGANVNWTIRNPKLYMREM